MKLKSRGDTLEIISYWLVTSEHVRGFNRKSGTERVCIKFHIQKAFDTIDCHGLVETIDTQKNKILQNNCEMDQVMRSIEELRREAMIKRLWRIISLVDLPNRYTGGIGVRSLIGLNRHSILRIIYKAED